MIIVLAAVIWLVFVACVCWRCAFDINATDNDLRELARR